MQYAGKTFASYFNSKDLTESRIGFDIEATYQ